MDFGMAPGEGSHTYDSYKKQFDVDGFRKCPTVPDHTRGEVDPDYAIWFERRSCANDEPEPEPERPAKRPHIQAFDDKIRKRLAWGEKEKKYQATIHALEDKLRNLTFDNDLQAQEAEGERRRLIRENEALRAQLRDMRVAAEKPARSEKDEKLISSLRLKVNDYEADLTKAEKDFLRDQAQLAKSAEKRTRLTQQLKQKYDRGYTILKKKLTTLENEMVQQTKNFKAEREHCYTLISRLEEDMQQLQDQNHMAT
ncbi:uncharacterized protein [Nicotiana sylvestris]|uniref:uncharacterized protein n=1 Tax=Nicotiana sylvestris TaxID=4096 RepID=UPI00388C7165